MSKLKELIHEVHRRSLWQVLGIYVVGSWVALQVVETLSETVGLPEWFGPVAFGLLIIGLPIVMATAFVQEGVGAEGKAATAGGHPSPASRVAAARSEPAAARSPEAASFPHANGETEAPDATSATGSRRLFTWRNALLGGVAAFTLLGLFTGGYLALRSLGIGPAGTLQAKGILEDRAPILLAEFSAESDGKALARAATEAFRVDLTQSEAVRLAEPAFVNQALVRMEREAGTPLDFELARELAVREGIPAVVGGEILAAGGSFVLSARLVRAESGEELAAFRETARDSSDVVPSIDRLSQKLRSKIGESLRSVRREQPLERVTTANLEALRKYSDALRAIDEADSDRGIALLEEALALDSTFAMAWRKLGIVHFNRGNQEEYEEALGEAFELRDRLTETERYLTEGSYHQAVTEDRQAAITAYRNLLERDPTNSWALNNLGVLYSRAGEFEAAAEHYERALAVDSTNVLAHTNLAETRVNLRHHAEAEQVLDAAAARFPGHPNVSYRKGRIAAARMAWDTARARFEAHREIRPGDPGPRIGAEFALGALARTRGRLEDAWQHRQAAQAARLDDGQELPNLPGIGLAWDDILIRRDPDRAAARADSILAAHPLEEVPEEDRPHGMLVALYGLSERPERARAHLAAARAAAEATDEPMDEEDVAAGRMAVALAEGRFEEAIEHAEAVRRASDDDCPVCDLPPVAEVYDRAGVADSARALWERFATTPDYDRMWPNSNVLARAYERLGQLYEQAGDPEKAALYYAKFVELWADADEDLQPRVQAARERLEAIVAERG